MAKDSYKEFREKIADHFVHLLETEKENWVKEWSDSMTMRPYNPITHVTYKGVNWLNLLWDEKTESLQPLDDPRFVTFNQIADKGKKYHPEEKWTLKKGAKGKKVEYWSPYNAETKHFLTWTEYDALSAEDQRDCRLIPMYYTVFSAKDVEGMPPLEIQEKKDIEAPEYVHLLADEMNVPILPGGNRAYYTPARDEVHLPDIGQFETAAGYAGVAMHELAHATGAKHRLNRDQSGSFGSPEYALEELVAEITSCFMVAEIPEVDMTAFQKYEDNATAYTQSWIEEIKEKPEALGKAITMANQAADFMAEKIELALEKRQEQTKEQIKEEQREQQPELVLSM